MITTRCKFKCERVELHTGGAKSAIFIPVSSGSKENESFWKYTPSGSLSLTWLNPNVDFMPDKEYYLDISEAQVV